MTPLTPLTLVRKVAKVLSIKPRIYNSAKERIESTPDTPLHVIWTLARVVGGKIVRIQAGGEEYDFPKAEWIAAGDIDDPRKRAYAWMGEDQVILVRNVLKKRAEENWPARAIVDPMNGWTFVPDVSPPFKGEGDITGVLFLTDQNLVRKQTIEKKEKLHQDERAWLEELRDLAS